MSSSSVRSLSNMSEGLLDFMGNDPYELRLGATLGEAVRAWLRDRYPEHTAKRVATDLRCDPRTAENLIDGHLSATNATKLLRAYGWRFWMAVGAAVAGETYEQSIEREMEAIAHERAEIEARERRVQSDYARLRARVAVDRGGLRLVAETAPEPRSRSDQRA